MSRLLITGAGGLVGSHLVNALKGKHEMFTISGKRTDATNLPIDFTKEWDAVELPKDLDVIIHLAQSEHFKNFPARALDVFNTNTLSTVKLIDHAYKTGVKKFIFASTGGVYGFGDEAFSEEGQIVYKDSLGFYIGTKHCAEVVLDNYQTLLDVIQLRLFFVYGQGQRQDMLVPRLLNSVREGKPITLQGVEGIRINPTHVEDVVRSIEASLSLSGSHKINIAGSEILSLKQVAETIGDAVGKAPLFMFEQDKKANHLIADTQLMQQLLVTPTISFKQGITTLL